MKYAILAIIIYVVGLMSLAAYTAMAAQNMMLKHYKQVEEVRR
jgi:hypothetical protein